MGEKERVNAYLETLRRMEPDIAMIDAGAALASIAISLKRIADALEGEPPANGRENILERVGNEIQQLAAGVR